MMLRRFIAWTLIAGVGLIVFAAATTPPLTIAAGLTALIGVAGFVREVER